VDLPLALKYRPSSFKDVIGQEKVTNSLMAALSSKQIHHAYLFSGPRGCGKTSSARILARSLNCEVGPIAIPCNQCQSCRDLVANGPGSFDVIEMDAATHGLVDDARELRDKALFAPVQSRYKIYIIDEAHQLGPAAANALLKIVEEPPPYVIFIFATTEPEKVIPTIRSRTHHYQFRLVGPETLRAHLLDVSQRENVTLDDGALNLAVRAGSGSVRDSLSALGQLINGADSGKVSYESALDLLSHTSNDILNQVTRGLMEQNATLLLEEIRQFLDAGGDPRRFVLDLLDHLRDLMVLSASNGERNVLFRSYTEDEIAHLTMVTRAIPIPTLISLTEIAADHLIRLRGVVPPQIVLETMMMRLLHSLAPIPSSTKTVEEPPRKPVVQEKEISQIKSSSPQPSPSPLPRIAPQTQSHSKVNLVDLKSLESNWPRVLEGVKNRRRLTWTLLSSNSFPSSLESGVAKIALPSAGALDSFERSNSGDVLLSAMKDVFDGEFKVEMIVQTTRNVIPSSVHDLDLADSTDEVLGEELLMRALGAQVISKEEQ
jgi:DNA polymerase-3 subunit gamma/tau